MDFNIWVFFVAALVPLITGAIWYNPKVFGAAWLKTSGLTDEEAQSGNMAVIFGLSYVFGLFLAVMLLPIVVHQLAISSLMIDEVDFAVVGSESQVYFTEIMERFNGNNRNFGHGAFHGAFAGIFFALPIIGTLGLFERRGFKYMAIHVGYWTITLALMGGVIANWV
jgi:hypothetical protein